MSSPNNFHDERYSYSDISETSFFTYFHIGLVNGLMPNGEEKMYCIRSIMQYAITTLQWVSSLCYNDSAADHVGYVIRKWIYNFRKSLKPSMNTDAK